MATTSIEWTEKTWNPTTGCDKISSGCKFCYAEIMSQRLKAMGQPKYRDGFAVRCHEDALGLPLTWRKPAVVFVNSMSDLFHEEVPLDFIQKVFAVMNQCPQHTFQVLTKRAERLGVLGHAGVLQWTPNIWMGVSVENAGVLGRVDHLRRVPAAVRFLSCEPLLGSLKGLDLTGIHWVIAGGESGVTPRPMDGDWARELRDACSAEKVAFFFKQWGGRNKGAAGRELDGRTHDDFPTGRAIS